MGVQGEAAGPLYPHINTVWKRNPKTNRVLIGDYATPELEYLRNNAWWWYEKVDGTNIRLHWDGERVLIGGRTDNAQIPKPLHDHLLSIIPEASLWAATFDGPVTVYGEGFGPGIQKVGKTYGDHPAFAVFDIKIDHWWLHWDNVQAIAAGLGFETVPFLGKATLLEAVHLVKVDEGVSNWAETGAVREGFVGRPPVELHDRKGHRIIVKVKRVDYGIDKVVANQ